MCERGSAAGMLARGRKARKQSQADTTGKMAKWGSRAKEMMKMIAIFLFCWDSIQTTTDGQMIFYIVYC
jgi:hypothetical protein